MTNNDEPDAATLKQMKIKRLISKSEVSAWGLVYYLRMRKLNELENFQAALQHMPRDMYLDRTEVLKTFCRSTGLMRSDNPNEIDEARFQQFADQWVKFLNNTPKPGYETRIEVVPETNTASNPENGYPGAGGDEGGEFGGS